MANGVWAKIQEGWKVYVVIAAILAVGISIGAWTARTIMLPQQVEENRRNIIENRKFVEENQRIFLERTSRLELAVRDLRREVAQNNCLLRDGRPNRPANWSLDDCLELATRRE